MSSYIIHVVRSGKCGWRRNVSELYDESPQCTEYSQQSDLEFRYTVIK